MGSIPTLTTITIGEQHDQVIEEVADVTEFAEVVEVLKRK